MESCFYTLCNPIVVGCKLFQNNLATIPVIDGYYSNGNNCFHVTGGTVQEITVCASGGTDCIDYTVSSSAASPQPVNYINCSGQANVDYVGGAGGVDIIHVCAQEGTVSVGPGISVSSNGECVAIGECQILNVTISQLDVDASDNSTVTMTYTDCYGGQSTYPFNDGGTFNIELCVSNGSSFAFSYLQGGATMNSGASGAIIQGPCTPTPTFRAWHFSSPGRPSPSNSCGNHTFTNTFYSQYVGGTIPAMGSTMYLDQGLTSPVAGGDQWFNLQEAYMDDLETVYQINSSGQLSNFQYCAT